MAEHGGGREVGGVGDTSADGEHAGAHVLVGERGVLGDLGPVRQLQQTEDLVDARRETFADRRCVRFRPHGTAPYRRGKPAPSGGDDRVGQEIRHGPNGRHPVPGEEQLAEGTLADRRGCGAIGDDVDQDRRNPTPASVGDQQVDRVGVSLEAGLDDDLREGDGDVEADRRAAGGLAGLGGVGKGAGDRRGGHVLSVSNACHER